MLATIWTAMVDDIRLLLDKARPGLGRFAVPMLVLWLAIGLPAAAALAYTQGRADGHSAANHALHAAFILAAVLLLPRGLATKFKLRSGDQARAGKSPKRRGRAGSGYQPSRRDRLLLYALILGVMAWSIISALR